jgi:rod shape-determining protein MreD
MRWFPVLLLAYAVIGIQAGAGALLRVDGVGPNFGLLLAVFVSLCAEREPALLACVVIGAMQDLATGQAPGLYALSYGLSGWFIASLQNVVYRQHPLTHATLVLVAGIISGLVIYLHGRYPGPRVSLSLLMGSAVYTTLLAPPALWLLQRSRRLLGMPLSRRRGYL